MPFCTKCGASVAGAFCSQCGTPTPAASGSPSPAAPTPPAAAGPLPRKTSPLVWVLVAVFGVLLLGGLAVAGFTFFVVHKARQAGISSDLFQRNPAAATARILAAANPDIEIVSEDDGAGTVTVRDRNTGKTTTWNLDQAKRGKFTITTEEEDGKNATVEFGPGSSAHLPAWLPSYPGATVQGTFAVTGNTADGAGGNFSFTTSDAPSKVLSFYQDQVKDLGMKVQVNTTTPAGGMFTATEEGDHRSLTVIVGESSGKTTVNVTYGSK